MKVWISLFLVILIVMVSGCAEPTHEELVLCSTDADCICGLILVTDQCYMGNRFFIEPSDRCFRLCFADDTRKPKCISGECKWIKIKKEQPDFPVADIIYGVIQEEDNLTEVTVKNTGPVAFSPTLKLTITRDNVGVYSTEMEYETLEPGSSQAKQIPIPPREEVGEWFYNISLVDVEGRLINHSSVVKVKLPEPVIEAYMEYLLEESYLVLKNISMGVRNVGNVTFIPLIEMDILRRGEVVHIETKTYKSLGPGVTETGEFILPVLDNATYMFAFVLKEKLTLEDLDKVNFNITIGTNITTGS
ncbi:MAG: hypothetical protein KAU24_03990 [Candidatus Aenigmarchaeota archaeon]|nr:hypothetical protein [Candidatus Aenigmarchaeota archaeon]